MNSRPKSVVLVDDEKSYTELLSQLLTDHLDCPVHAFTRPLDALQALPQLDAAVVVTDYHMPQLTGFEFIHEAGRVAPHAVFVLISGHNLSAENDRMQRMTRLKGFLPKPFSWRQLAEEIQRVWPKEQETPSQRADATSL